MGALTHSKLDRAVIARYFTFLVISQLVIFTLIGVIFSWWLFLMKRLLRLISVLRFRSRNHRTDWQKGKLSGNFGQFTQ